MKRLFHPFHKSARARFINTMAGLTMLGLSASAPAQTDRNQLNSTIQIQYGIVTNVTKVKLKSNAGKNVITGGLLGYATSGHKDRDKHTAEGAFAAGLLTKIAEGDNKAFQYEVDEVKGGQIKIIMKDGSIQQGDCVAIEQGKTSNLRRVASVHCEHHDHPVMQQPEVVNKATNEAEDCHKAKEIVMQAKNEAELDMAMKKMHIFCESQ